MCDCQSNLHILIGGQFVKETLLGDLGKACRTVNAVPPQLRGIEKRIFFTLDLFQHLIVAHTQYKALRRSVE